MAVYEDTRTVYAPPRQFLIPPLPQDAAYQSITHPDVPFPVLLRWCLKLFACWALIGISAVLLGMLISFLLSLLFVVPALGIL